MYIACINSKFVPGVVKKINQTVSSLNKNGYSASAKIIWEGGIFKTISKCLSILFVDKSKTVIVRFSYLLPFLTPLLILRRIKGDYLILDMPTPLTTLMSEINNEKRGDKFGAFKLKLWIGLTFPLSMLVFSRINQYSKESSYFKLGVRHKTVLISNGIMCDEVHFRRRIPKWPGESFVLIGVASVADWHGYDRVIRGIASYKAKANELVCMPQFRIVGEGGAVNDLKLLAKILKVEDLVSFDGLKNGSELDFLFEQAHVAVASLALYRKGLHLASDLKTREYAARGVPLIVASDDIDFNPLPNFVLRFENNGEEIDINTVIRWYSSLNFDDEYAQQIRGYAQLNLDFSNKIKNFIK